MCGRKDLLILSLAENDEHVFDYHGQKIVRKRRHGIAVVHYKHFSFISVQGTEAVGSHNIWIRKVVHSFRNV